MADTPPRTTRHDRTYNRLVYAWFAYIAAGFVLIAGGVLLTPAWMNDVGWRLVAGYAFAGGCGWASMWIIAALSSTTVVDEGVSELHPEPEPVWHPSQGEPDDLQLVRVRQRTR